jgi:pyruvate dehydrogenase E2 component (dihydrolipoamide acetyltransferase)
VAILGVGRIVSKVVPWHDQIVIRERLALSLTIDHRAVDGAPAARFFKRIKDMIENPYRLLLHS